MSAQGRYDIRHFETIDSTNAYLLQEARKGGPEGIVAVAEHQSAGRGRLGRTWEAPPGASLLASVLLRPELAAGELHLCTAALALAARAACQAASGASVSIKWPNDLVIGDAKVAGVLAESDPGAPGGPLGSTAIVVGIGINLRWPGPPGVGGTCLRDATGVDVDRLALLDGVLEELSLRRGSLDVPADRQQIAEELRAQCSTLGREVRVDLGEETIEGLALDLSDEGHLVVEVAGIRREVAAGDVVHLRATDS